MTSEQINEPRWIIVLIRCSKAISSLLILLLLLTILNEINTEVFRVKNFFNITALCICIAIMFAIFKATTKAHDSYTRRKSSWLLLIGVAFSGIGMIQTFLL